jgi:hypothetical protein
MKKNLVEDAISNLEQTIFESRLSQKHIDALAKLESGNKIKSAVTACKRAIDANPSIDIFKLANTTAESYGIDAESLMQLIKDYKPINHGNAVNESFKPGMERWIRKNKSKFKSKYGKDWEQILYATAWELHNR